MNFITLEELLGTHK